jgi:hypothetical protein
MNKIFVTIAAAVMLSACSKNTVRVSGNIAEADKQILYFERVNIGKNTVLDSV